MLTRILSGAVLLALAIAIVWLAPPLVFLAVAELLLGLAIVEYARLAKAGGLSIPVVASMCAAVLTSVAVAAVPSPGPGVQLAPPVDVVFMTASIALAAVMLGQWRGEQDAIARTAATLFPSIYLGMPIGAMVAVRQSHGAAALFLLVLTIIVSDTAQYFTGRFFGRRPLAPAISPKKTIEGAVGGFIAGPLLLFVAGAWWLPTVGGQLRVLVGIAMVALGIAGDLFESMLKRSAGVKDSSALIPGHGGVLDRIDALLFAAPIYYIVLKYV
jgi:phosphatidate cytidylyltransferase